MDATAVMLTAEQFSQLATKEDFRKLEAATKSDSERSEKRFNGLEKQSSSLEKQLGSLEKQVSGLEKQVAGLDKKFATKDDLKNFATKDDIKSLDNKFELKFSQLEYMLTTSFDHLNYRMDRMEKRAEKHDRDINELNLFTVDHAMRIKKLEFRCF